jgi:hypothetical protein
METYSHTYLCKECGQNWLARYFKPLRVPKKHKTCSTCAKKSAVQIDGGNAEASCAKCVHFNPVGKVKFPWGECNLGLSSDPEDGHGLVYSGDICDQYEPQSEEEIEDDV